MKKKLAILGIDHGHCNAIINAAAQREDVALTAIAQETSPFADKLAESKGAKEYRDYMECLQVEKPDIVGVAMFNGERGKWIAEALGMGIPVITDKPLCVSHEDLDGIKKAHEKMVAPLCMMLTCRCVPAYLAIKSAVEKGMIGEPVAIEGMRHYALNRPNRPDWMFHSDSYGGPGVDILIHDYDLARWISGKKWGDLDLTEVRSGLFDDVDFKDIASISSSDNGTVLNLNMTWHGKGQHWDRFAVYGSEAFIELPLSSNAPVLYDEKGNAEELELPESAPFAEQFFSALLDGDCDFPISAQEAFEVVGNIIRARDFK